MHYVIDYIYIIDYVWIRWNFLRLAIITRSIKTIDTTTSIPYKRYRYYRIRFIPKLVINFSDKLLHNFTNSKDLQNNENRSSNSL